MASFSAHREKNCPKRTFRSDFIKLGSSILYLFLAEKMVVCFAQIFLIRTYFLENCSSWQTEKNAVMFLNSTRGRFRTTPILISSIDLQ